MVGCKLIIKKKKAEGGGGGVEGEEGDWLSKLLHCEFFGSCVEHHHLRKSEKNVFCIDCNLEFCRHCDSAHCLHRRLQICKYVYQDVVRLQDIQKHLDCSRIQTYKINGEKAVHLNPRPQLKDAKPSTKSKTGASCEACGRYLQDLPNRFCSIACKVCIVSLKPKEQSHKIIPFPIEECADLSWKNNNCNSENSSSCKESSISFTDPSDESQGWTNSTLKPRKLLHKRKGIPHRAPLS